MLTPKDLTNIRGIIRQATSGLAKKSEVREIVREEVNNAIETKVRPIVKTEVSSQLKKELRPIKKDIKIIVRFFDRDITYLRQQMTRVESVLQLSPLPYRNGAEL